MDERYKTWTKYRLQSHSRLVESGCIEWQASGTTQGYGQISIQLEPNKKRKLMMAHRAQWMITNDVLLRRDQYVLHKCDNPKCINIDHLFLGTAKDNTQDMMRKGRWRRGEIRKKTIALGRKPPKKHTRQCQVSNETVLAIRNATGKTKWIAEEHGVTPGYVSKIRRMQAKTLVK